MLVGIFCYLTQNRTGWFPTSSGKEELKLAVYWRFNKVIEGATSPVSKNVTASGMSLCDTCASVLLILMNLITGYLVLRNRRSNNLSKNDTNTSEILSREYNSQK
jgi:hypothetical protein